MKQSFKDLDTGDELLHEPGKATVQNNEAEKFVEVSPDKIEIRNGSGKRITLTLEEGMVITDGTNTTTADFDGKITITDGSKTITLSVADAQLLLDGGAGKTNSVTDEQMVIAVEGAEHAIYEAKSIALDDGTGNTSEVSIDNGLKLRHGEYKADVTALDGAKLDNGAGMGTVTIAPQDGKTISLLDTNFCEDVEGTPTTKHAHVLRGVTETL